MFNKSIAYRLSIFISGAVISVFVVIIVISFLLNRQYVYDNIKNKGIRLSNELMQQAEEPLITTREITSEIAGEIIFYAQNNHPEILLEKFIKKNPFINTIMVDIYNNVPGIDNHYYNCYRSSNDSIVFRSLEINESVCLREKDIINKIVKTKKPGWTDISFCKRNKKRIITFYSPIFLNPKSKILAGTVICEITVDNLNNIVNSIKVGEGGFAFILSADGHFITHPRKEFILKKSIFSFAGTSIKEKRTILQNALINQQSGTFIAFPKFLNGEKHWVYYTSLNEIDWIIVFAMPYNHLFKPLYISTLLMLSISAIGIIIIFLLIKYITNKLIEPLSKVTAQLHEFSSYAGSMEYDTLNEIYLVSKSLNSLKTAYEKYKIKQTEDEKNNHRRIEEILQAAEIQQSLIKSDFKSIAGVKEIDIFAIYKPAKIVSGDLFDFFLTDSEHLLFTIGDVSGKGVAAALFMSVAQTIIKNVANLGKAGDIVKNASIELHTKNKHQFFLTLFLGILNLKTGELNYCNAAHTSTYILKENGGLVLLDQSHGLPLGLYSDKDYSDSEITLQKGDSIILYTDGVTDLRNEDDKHYGNAELEEMLKNLADMPPKKLVKQIELSLDIYKGKAPQTDDITLMDIKYKA